MYVVSINEIFSFQFDFKSQTLSDIQQGRRAEKIEFKDVLSYQSEVYKLCIYIQYSAI